MDTRVRYPQLHDFDWLNEQYTVQGRSCPEIATALECSPATVQQALQRLNIPRRGRHYGRWNAKTCARCGNTFIPSGPAQKFCPTKECRFGLQRCVGCGAEFASQWQRKDEARGYCSRKCWYKSTQNPGRRCLTDGGYVVVWVGPDYPGVRSDGRVLEHRYVMQEWLGRPLRTDESVHHKNGDRTDNRLENLQLRSAYHGNGACARCGDCGSHNIVFDELG